MKREPYYIAIIILLVAYSVTAHLTYMKLKYKHEALVTTLTAPKAVASKLIDAWKEKHPKKD